MRFGWVVLTMMCVKFGCLATVMAADPKARVSMSANATANASAGGLDPAIVKVAETFRAAMLAGDAAAVVSVYRDDAVEMPSCAPLVRGRAAIEQYYRGLFAQGARFTAFTLTHLEAKTAGDTAYAVGTSAQTLAMPSKGVIDDTGKYLVVLKRTDGQWKVAYSMYSSDHPPIAPPPSAANR